MRGIRKALVVYAVLLLVMINIAASGALFFLMSIFFCMGITCCVKEYKDSLENLRKDMDSRLWKSEEEKKRLLSEIKISGDRISELRDKESMIASLYEVTKNTSTNLTFNEIFSALSIFLRENFVFKKSSLLILKESEGFIKVDKVYKVSKEESDDLNDAESNYGEVLELFSKYRKDVYILKEGAESFGAIPLLSENKFVGILTIEGLPRTDFDRLLIVAAQFALEIKKVLLYETVETLAITDSLTSLFTRRYFFERFNEELNRSKRHNFKFSFLMIDIDDFKKCNDTYGHMVGDVILRETAKVIKESVREIDLVARYGGEEFSIILPETDRKGSILVAERIRRKIEDNIFKAYDEKLKVTVSIGLSVYPEDSENSEDIVEKADKALYAAKSSGKNIVC